MTVRGRGTSGRGTRRSPPILLAAYLVGLVAVAVAAGSEVVRASSASVLEGALDGAPAALSSGTGPLLAVLEAARRDLLVTTIATGLGAAVLLYVVYRAARVHLDRQAARLGEAAERDGLTTMPSHGALVNELGAAIESARQDASTISVALIDLDSFRLLNDTHGHRAGDEALVRVGRLLQHELPRGMRVGRYGPDEFLVIGPRVALAQLEASVRCFRGSLTAVSLRLDQPDPVPITVSAGLAAYPQHAQSVTALLSVAALTLAEAKVSGGDSVRVAGVIAHDPVATRSFDVLKGLVQAVDTKDHYTKRHSDDVARYAIFIAGQLGMTEHFARALDIAGQLHDIGKIGVPDAILRKPGRLLADELRVMEQHATLGDMIVRDLPDIDLVRAGVRHHHERWDGRGYPDRIAGEAIPLIARILSVADAFSAMTTTRPYRKAYSMRHALQRLERAAGTQLDADLVRVFVHGVRTVPGAPMPHRAQPRPALGWVTGREVA
jgi:diguanylate cyclase (GGDEF)-like protein